MTGQHSIVPPSPAAPELFDWADERDTTMMVPVSPAEADVIVQALAERGQGNSLRPGLLAASQLAAEWRRMTRTMRTTVVPAAAGPDECSATGLPRPGGVR